MMLFPFGLTQILIILIVTVAAATATAFRMSKMTHAIMAANPAGHPDGPGTGKMPGFLQSSQGT